MACARFFHGSGPFRDAPEKAARAKENHQQEDHEDGGVLQLDRQHERRQLLHQPDRKSAPERADDRAHPAEDYACIHDDHIFKSDIGLERIESRDQPARDRGDAGAQAKCDAMGARDVDPHIDRRLRIVGCGAKRLAETRTGDEQEKRDDDRDAQERGDQTGLVQENRDIAERLEHPRGRGQRRTDRHWFRSEDDQTGILNNQSNAERQDKLGVMTFAFGLCDPQPGDVRHQRIVDEVTDNKQNRPGEQRRYEGARIGAEQDRYPEQREARIGGIHTEHHQVALGEIDDAHDSENEPEPGAHQAVETTYQKARTECLGKILNKDLRRAHCTARCYLRRVKL